MNRTARKHPKPPRILRYSTSFGMPSSFTPSCASVAMYCPAKGRGKAIVRVDRVAHDAACALYLLGKAAPKGETGASYGRSLAAVCEAVGAGMARATLATLTLGGGEALRAGIAANVARRAP